ncbi:MAG: diacylglycerol kinase family lipid kinase [Pyrinomonadaceae bacterium]
MSLSFAENIEGPQDPGLPLIIVNPKSAGGSTKNRWSQLAADMRAHFGPFTVAFTKAGGDGAILARKFVENGRRFIIACGGDGTINEVANGILESGIDAELGVLPAGTGGDFRRSLGLSASPREAAKQLRNGRTEKIDVGRAGFIGKDGEKTGRFFVNIASFGLSASINQRVKAKGEFAWIPSETVRGRTKFALSTIQEVLETNFRTIKVSLDGAEAYTLNTINFCICNARYFGGGMMIAPEANLCDGRFDLINIGDINTARIMLNGYRLYSGSHLEMPEVKAKRVERIEVEPLSETESIDIEIDGELPGRLPAVFEIVPKALNVRVPNTK